MPFLFQEWDLNVVSTPEEVKMITIDLLSLSFHKELFLIYVIELPFLVAISNST